MDRETIVERISVPEALEMLGMEGPERTPGHMHCFMHGETTPSLMVYDDHWHAFCCGVGGDVINLVMRAANVNYSQAVAFLSGAVDELEAPRVQRTQREVIDLTERWMLEPHGGIQSEIAAEELIRRRWPSLTLSDLYGYKVKLTQHALWVAHYNLEGRIVGIKTRSIYSGKKNAVKGSTFSTALYSCYTHFNQTAILCEGESDTWAMTKAAAGCSVYGLPVGAKTWRPFFREQLQHHDRILLALDTDRTGREATELVKKHLEGLDVKALEIPGEDVAEAIGRGWIPGMSVAQ